MAKQFKQIMGSVSRPDLLLLEYDQAVKDGYVRLRERKTGTRIIIDLERYVADSVEEVVKPIVETKQEIVEEPVEAETVNEDSKESETPKTTARKTTVKKGV